MNKRKQDCTPEEWARRLSRQREYYAASRFNAKYKAAKAASARAYLLKHKNDPQWLLRRREVRARYRTNNRTQILAATAKRRSTAAHKAKVNEWARRMTERLYPSYVKRLLRERTNLSSAEIPAALVELKREQLKLKRLLKDQKNHEDNESTAGHLV